MAKDLAWFPFFIEAWLGGTLSMSQGEIGAYLLALIQQWKSGDMQAIRDTPRAILTICRGKMSAEVRSKFISIEIDGQAYLRNARLFEIYNDQTARHKMRVDRAADAARAKHEQTISRPQADGEQASSGAYAPHKEEIISLSTGSKSPPSKIESNKETRSKPKSVAFSDGEIFDVFDNWRQVLNHPQARLDEKRKKLIRARGCEGFSVADLKLAAVGCKKSPHHQGQTNGTIYDSINLIYRDTEHVERFIAFATGEALVEIAPKQRFLTEAEKLAANDALYASYGVI